MSGHQFLTRLGLGLFVIMLLMGSVLIFAFGAVTFSALLFLWLRGQLVEEHGALCCAEPVSREVNLVNGAILFVSSAWFVINLVAELFYAQGRGPVWVQLPMLVVVLMYPALIVHILDVDNPSASGAYVRARRILVRLMYGLCGCFALWLILGATAGVPFPFNRLQYIITALFTVVGVFGGITVSQSRSREEGEEEKQGKWWVLVLLAAMTGLSLLAAMDWFDYRHYLGVLLRSAPLFFILVGTYYGDRLEFFDVFVKRGTFFFVALILLMAFFALVVPQLENVEWTTSYPIGNAILKPLLYSALLLPLAVLLPWIYRRLEEWMDTAWLGRRFTPTEALQHFVAGVKEACSEQELVAQGERALEEIFQARTEIALGSGGPALEALVEIPIRRIDGEAVGVMRLSRRDNDTPYFSQDVKLLFWLGGVFSHVLENLRHQERRKELELHATEAELKALRAQVNPHFLFNALNAIAGLIYQDPERAEETVEQLAEVFRCTLSRSDREWVRLEEEIALVRCYLGVEQARFGERLTSSLDIAPELADAKVPSMMVQTLVENAVKHGIARLKSGGSLQVGAEAANGRVRIWVSDNGPGPTGDSDPARPGTGYGLKNIRERLNGHYAEEGDVRLVRDEQRGLTVATLEFPLSYVSDRRAG